MDQRQLDIADMQCWIFCTAQKKWNISPKECTKLFRDYDILGYLSECYELLHVSSYQCALRDVEDILRVNGVSVMETSVNSIPEDSKNTCAIQIMRTMLAKFSDRCGISFDDALLQFTQSDVYEILFDFDTEVWKEGPDYLMMLFKEELDQA